VSGPTKKPGEPHETYVERLIREAQEQGEFDRLAIRHEAEAVLAAVERDTDERVVRERLEVLNARIRRLNRTTVAGPPTSLAPLDVEAAVARWRASRGAG
jgi:hypothetical protein